MKKIIFIFVLVALMITVPIKADSPFSDVKESDWYYSYVNDIVSRGIANGYDGKFKPNEYVTRAQMSKILSNLINNQPVKIINNDDRVVEITKSSLPSTVEITTESGIGSGFFVKGLDGNNKPQILTAYHVIKDKNSIQITTYDNQKFYATVLKSDANSDLALLTIESTANFPFLKLENDVTLAEPTIIIGSNNGEPFTVTKGIISNLSRKGVIQTDASVNSGSSGSPLINQNGDCIGIIVRKMSDAGVDNITFAVRSQFIEAFYND